MVRLDIDEYFLSARDDNVWRSVPLGNTSPAYTNHPAGHFLNLSNIMCRYVTMISILHKSTVQGFPFLKLVRFSNTIDNGG